MKTIPTKTFIQLLRTKKREKNIIKKQKKQKKKNKNLTLTSLLVKLRRGKKEFIKYVN